MVFHAFEGQGEFTVDYAHKIAERGYAVFVVDMYGNGKVATTLEECSALYNPFFQDRSLARRRAVLAYEALLKQKNILTDKIGTVGFCFGGMCALELARSGANIKASVMIHSALKKSDLPTHPIKAHVLVLQGYEDPQVPPSCLESFGQEMNQAGVDDWTLAFFGHAKHSFSDPRTGTFDPVREKEMGREYNKTAADRAFRYAMDFFHEILI